MPKMTTDPTDTHPVRTDPTGTTATGPVVVTGASGFVGNALVRALLEEGRRPVRALVRGGGYREALAQLDIEIVPGDVSDPASLEAAFSGAAVVFHTAGLVALTGTGLRHLRKVNVGGTRNVLAACRAAGVKRLVYTSSVHAFVEPPAGSCLTEQDPIDPPRCAGSYSQSKAEATLLVLEAADAELDTVAVYPTGIIGPYDYQPSHLGQLVLDTFHRRLWAYVDGAYDFIDVRDVALGMIAAADRGRPGEGYLLTGHVVTVIDLLRELERLSGVPAPRLRLPLALARAAGTVAPFYYRLRGQKPLFSRFSCDVISSNHSMDRTKAETELGFRPRPLADTLDDTLRWFRRHGSL